MIKVQRGKTQTVIAAAVVTTIVIITVAVLIFLASGNTARVALRIEQDSDKGILLTLAGELSKATDLTLEMLVPDELVFDSLVDLSDSNRVLRLVKIESKKLRLHIGCAEGLPKELAVLKFSALGEEIKPLFHVSTFSCFDKDEEEIDVEFSME